MLQIALAVGVNLSPIQEILLWMIQIPFEVQS